MTSDAPAGPSPARAADPRGTAPTGTAPTGTDPGHTRPIGITFGPDGEILVAGAVDLSTSRALRAALDKAAARGGEVLVDLRDVQLLQSPGVAALFDAAEHGLRLRVRTASAVASVIRICGLDRVAAVELLP
jgi:anti-anti-sigma factor